MSPIKASLFLIRGAYQHQIEVKQDPHCPVCGRLFRNCGLAGLYASG